LGILPANTTLELPCVSTPDSYAAMLNLTIYNNASLVNASIANWTSAVTFALYYDANYTLGDGDLFVVSRNASSYETLWDFLTYQIIKEHILPYNYPLFLAYNLTQQVGIPASQASPPSQRSRRL